MNPFLIHDLIFILPVFPSINSCTESRVFGYETLINRSILNMAVISHRFLSLVALWILFSILGLHFVTVFQKMFTYSNNNKDYYHIKHSQTLKPLLEPKRTMHCPNPVIIQDPQKAIINEISKNTSSMDCSVNINAGKYVIFDCM